ncbi:hypothetical protein RJT34_20546 [Clitoria ternatea]|uniref:LOB domain-containing protein n=1 Tax=Clitoria ternatea TaxID=43366 RepID=A0AAN9IT04_CLITE
MGFHDETKARIHQPCAACRILRRRCDNKCLLAPYFPTHELENFVGVHRVFGASNVIKMIQMVEETKREDAVKAMVYEATARLRDPVYGSAGCIYHLQKMIQELNEQLELIKTRVSELQQQKDQLLNINSVGNNIFDDFSIDFDHPMASDDPIFEFPEDGDCHWLYYK